MRNTRKAIVGLDFSGLGPLRARYPVELAILVPTPDQARWPQMGHEAGEC